MDLMTNDQILQAEDVTDEIDALHEKAETLAALAKTDLENATRLRREANDLVRQAATVRAQVEEG